MAKVKVYISGQISGLDDKEVKENFNMAEEILAHAGLEPVNPLKVTAHLDPKKTKWEDFMAEDIKALFGCKMIYMLPNWGQSKGARVEYAIAQSLGLRIMFQESN